MGVEPGDVRRRPSANETVQRNSGTKRLILELSKTNECALSPKSPAPMAGSTLAMKSDGMWTNCAWVPAAAAMHS
jgi:hypothetical protein